MKKIFAILLAIMMALSLAACGGGDGNDDKTPSGSEDKTPSSSQQQEDNTPDPDTDEPDDNSLETIEVKRLGETIETDILRITLGNAQLAIKLNATSYGTYEQIMSGQTTISDDYFTADEYDPVNDVGKAYVAAKGHTYVVIEYKAENLDRASVEFDGTFNKQFMTVEYAGEAYTGETNYGCTSKDGYEWTKYNSNNILLLAGEKAYLRCYIDIPTDADNLDDDFALIFSLPCSDGTTTDFKYLVTAEDRIDVGSQEIPLDEAIYSFKEPEGEQYFLEHLEEYFILTGDEIEAVIANNRKWKMVIKEDYGSWSGQFAFESDGKIKETIYDGSEGYFNDRAWAIRDDTLIISTGNDEENVCEMRKVSDNAYLLTSGGAIYALMDKS